MKKLLVIVLVLALLAMPCALAEGATLTVRGTGVVTMNADRASISVGVRQMGPDVREVQSSVNATIEAVIEALIAKGISEADIATDSIGIYAEYSYDDGEERIIGYNAYNTIRATTSDIDNVGAYIDAAFEAGANSLDGVYFSAADTTEAGDKALALAVENAAAKAEVLAQAAGMKLGAIQSIEQGNGYDDTVVYAKEEAAADAGMTAATRVIASQLTMRANVTVVYALEPVE